MLPTSTRRSILSREGFTESMEESTSAAPVASHIEKKKHKRALESDKV
jgi:hypothetical protein